VRIAVTGGADVPATTSIPSWHAVARELLDHYLEARPR